MATVKTRVPPVLPILPMEGIPEPFVQAINSRLRSLADAIGTTPAAAASTIAGLPGLPGAGGGPASPDKSVQFNKGGVFAGSADFTYDPGSVALGTEPLLTVNGTVGYPVIAAGNGYIQSDGGFAVTPSTGVQFNVIQAVAGGAMTSAYYVADYGGLGGYFQLKTLGYDGNYPQPVGGAVFGDSDLLLWNSGGNGTAVPNINQGLCCNGYFDGAAGFYTGAPYYDAIQAPWGGVVAAAIAAVETPDFARGGYIGMNPLGYGNFPGPIQLPAFSTDSLLLWAGTENGTTAPPVTGGELVGLQCNGYMEAAGGFLTNNTITNAIQAPSGGVTAKWLIAEDSLFFLGLATPPPLAGAGQARFYFSTSGTLMYSWNGAAYVPVGGGTGGGAAGAATQVQYNVGAGVFGASANFTFDSSTHLLTVGATAGNPAIAASGGYIQSDGGFAVTPSTGTQWNVIQATAGGANVSAYRTQDANSKGGYIQLHSLSYGNYPVPVAGATFATSPADVLLWNAGVNGTSAPVTAQDLCCNATMNAAGGFYTDMVSGAAIQAPSGGISVGLGMYSKVRSSPPYDPADGYGGWCYQGGSKYWYYNYSTGSWATVDLAATGGTSAAGIVNQVQYNAGSGAFGASANFTFVPGTRLLTVSTTAGNPGMAVSGGYIQSDQGFAVTPSTGTAYNAVQCTAGGAMISAYYAADSASKGGYIQLKSLSYGSAPTPVTGAVFQTSPADILIWNSGSNTATAVTTQALCTNGFVNAAGGLYTALNSGAAIQAPNGGIALGLAVYLKALSSAPFAPGAGFGGWAHRSGSTYWYFNSTSSAWAYVDLAALGGTSVAGSDKQVQFNSGNVLSADPNFIYDKNLQLLSVTGKAGTAAINASTGYIQSNAGIVATDTDWNSIQTAGGVRVLGAVQIGPAYNTDQSAAGSGWLLHAQGSGTVLLAIDAYGTGPVPAVVGRHIEGSVASPSATPAGATLLSLSGRGSYPGGIIGQGAAAVVLQAAEQWNSSGTQGTQIVFQTTPVGASARRTLLTVSAGGACYFEGAVCLAGFPGSPPAAGGSYGGLSYQSGSTYWYWNGSNWSTLNLSTLANTSSVVTSLTAGTGVSLSASTGAVTVSIGQNVATNAGVTFASVVGNLFNAVAAGTSISFQTSNGQFQVNGNGQVSALEFNCNGGSSGPSGYKINGVVCIDYTGTIVRSVQTSGNIFGGQFGISGVFVGGTDNIQVTTPTGTATLHFQGGLYRNYTTP